MEEFMLPCLNKRIFGVECLGCGLQRGAFFLIKGEFGAAFAIYPGIFPLVLLLSFISLNFFFFPIKHYTKVVWILGILTGLTMVFSYVLKHF